MSADNGIYIHKFRNGWKVIHAQAIDNIYWWYDSKKKKYVKKDKINPKELFKYFKNAKLYKTREEAYNEAERKLIEVGYAEYGIGEI